MLKNKKWGIFFFAVGLTVFSLSGQNFSDFFVDFIRYPENQTKHIQFPLKTDNAIIKNSAFYNPVTFLTRNNIPILCTDSLNAIGNSTVPTVSIVQFNKEAVTNYTFDLRNKKWKLVSYKNENIQNLQETEFLTFLIQYSKDESFQMKHTIFPFPYHVYNKLQKQDCEPDNKLLMPREWMSLDFTAIFPALCIFNSNAQAPNRQLFVFRNGKITQFFNFIRINKKWYLIEIEEYK